MKFGSNGAGIDKIISYIYTVCSKKQALILVAMVTVYGLIRLSVCLSHLLYRPGQMLSSLCQMMLTHKHKTHTHTHARTHARTLAHTHTQDAIA